MIAETEGSYGSCPLVRLWFFFFNSFRRKEFGAPCKTRTSDLLVRSQEKGANAGQPDAAAPDFIGVLSHAQPPETTPSRYRLSVICQSLSARPLTIVACPALAIRRCSSTCAISGCRSASVLPL